MSDTKLSWYLVAINLLTKADRGVSFRDGCLHFAKKLKELGPIQSGMVNESTGLFLCMVQTRLPPDAILARIEGGMGPDEQGGCAFTAADQCFAVALGDSLGERNMKLLRHWHSKRDKTTS